MNTHKLDLNRSFPKLLCKQAKKGTHLSNILIPTKADISWYFNPPDWNSYMNLEQRKAFTFLDLIFVEYLGNKYSFVQNILALWAVIR